MAASAFDGISGSLHPFFVGGIALNKLLTPRMSFVEVGGASVGSGVLEVGIVTWRLGLGAVVVGRLVIDSVGETGLLFVL